jgi:hypothetical protein
MIKTLTAAVTLLAVAFAALPASSACWQVGRTAYCSSNSTHPSVHNPPNGPNGQYH